MDDAAAAAALRPSTVDVSAVAADSAAAAAPPPDAAMETFPISPRPNAAAAGVVGKAPPAATCGLLLWSGVDDDVSDGDDETVGVVVEAIKERRDGGWVSKDMCTSCCRREARRATVGSAGAGCSGVGMG